MLQDNTGFYSEVHMAVEWITNESISDEDKSVNDAEQKSSQASTVKVESARATDHVAEAQYQNESKTFAKRKKVINQDIQNGTCDSIIKSNDNIETHKDDLLSSKERLCDAQLSIEEPGKDKKELITDGDEF